MGIVTGVTLAFSERFMEVFEGFLLRLGMAVITFRSRFFPQKIFKIRSVRGVTGSAFTFADRFMQMGTTLQGSEKVIMAGSTEFAARTRQEIRILRGMDLVAAFTLALDLWLMPNPAGKGLAFMAFEAVI